MRFRVALAATLLNLLVCMVLLVSFLIGARSTRYTPMPPLTKVPSDSEWPSII